MNKNIINSNVFNQEILLLLDTYYLELNYLKKQLKLLTKHKPLFFEFKKLKKYNLEKKENEDKIKLYEEKISNLMNNELS